jgi:hypothetical protein
MRRKRLALTATLAMLIEVQASAVAPSTRPTSRPMSVEERYGTSDLKPFVEMARQRLARIEQTLGEFEGLPPDMRDTHDFPQKRVALRKLVESARAELRELEAASTQPTTRATGKDNAPARASAPAEPKGR